jgi:4-hydroxybenzoate polyprenyltransferase
MVAVRSFAMAVNRLVDLPIDAKNPRTLSRPLVSGELHGFRNQGFHCRMRRCLYRGLLAAQPSVSCPVAFGFDLVRTVQLYQTFTPLCHFFLGSVLGLAPLAGWLAVSPVVEIAPVLLALGVTLWVGGFDILYACQDVEFDRAEGLHSLPAHAECPLLWPCQRSAMWSRVFFFSWPDGLPGRGSFYAGVCLAVALILLLEHRLISAQDMSRVNLAFFTMNGFVAVFLFAGAVVDTAFK